MRKRLNLTGQSSKRARGGGAMIFQSLCLGFLPLLDAIGGLVSTVLRTSIALHHSPNQHGGQFIHGLGTEETEAKSSSSSSSNHAAGDNSDPLDLWQLWTLDLLDTSHVHVDLAFPCACNLATAPTSQRSQPKPQIRRKAAADFGGGSGGAAFSFRRLVARHERHLTCAAVVAALQVFLRLTRANATTLFLPLLSQATGCAAAARAGDAVLVLVSACGVLGSARAARDLGREAMCAIGGVLVVLCQVAVPAVAGSAASLSSGGGGRMVAGGHAAAMFAAACAVSGGFSWAWGALFWAVPGEGVRSAGEAAGAALRFGLGFAQMQCFLLTLRQLKHAAFAYYAVWIWS
ncbi:unnamed protein product [Urochloa decumbens]|uniref:Uncharacterized protein n=2 Tax=Urochloa decumbens TaxID=240449 RepID=A0ABC9CX58_9POAL